MGSRYPRPAHLRFSQRRPQLFSLAKLDITPLRREHNIGAPANGEADKRRYGVEDHLGDDKADHFSRATRNTSRFNALLMPYELSENRKTLEGERR